MPVIPSPHGRFHIELVMIVIPEPLGDSQHLACLSALLIASMEPRFVERGNFLHLEKQSLFQFFLFDFLRNHYCLLDITLRLGSDSSFQIFPVSPEEFRFIQK